MKRSLFLTASFVSFVIISNPCLGENANYSFSFSQTGKTFSWNHSLNYKETIGEHLNLSASNQIRSKLTKSARQQDRWQDGSTTQLSLGCPFSEKLTLSVSSSANKSADNLYSKVLTRNVSAVFSYKPFRSLSLSQSLGQAFDRRLGYDDSGLSYNLSVSAAPRLPEKLNLTFGFGNSGNSLKRKNLNNNLSTSLRYRPSSALETQASLSQSRNEQGYYTTVGGADTLFVRRNQRSSITTNANFKPKTDLSIGYQMGYSRSRVRDPASDIQDNPKSGTNNEQDDFDLAVDVSAKFFGTDVKTGVSFAESNSDYTKFSLDKKTNSLSAKSSFGFNFFEDASLSLSAVLAKYSTDTPDPEEVSDRDDFKSSYSIAYSQGFENGLKLTVSASTEQNHSVNLCSERSANNQWSRRYSLDPRLEYRLTERLRLSHNYMLSANYTEYDFDDSNNPKSNITRLFSATNSLNFKLAQSLTLNANYGIRIQDYGKFYRNIGQAVAEDSQNHSVTFSLSYQGEKISISPRYSWNRNMTWKHTEIRELSRESTSRTLTLNISWAQLSVMGVRSVRESKTQARYVNDNITITYNRAF